MTTNRDQFVVSIQSVLQSLDDVTSRLQQTRKMCEEVLGEIQDESKLGSHAEFDFGKASLEKEGKKIHKEIHKKLDAIEKQLKSLSTPMKQEQSRLASKMVDKFASPGREK